MYKAIGFDYGGVLNFSKSVFPGFSEITGISVDELKAHYFKQNQLANLGEVSYEQLWTKILTELGHQDKIDQVIEHMHKQLSRMPNPEMIALVDEIKNLGYKTGLFSNNTKDIGQDMRKQGLDKHFDAFLISAEVGYQKPSTEAYNLLCKKLNVLPEELIFVDDSPTSLSSANEIGYHPILFKDYNQFREELGVLKILK